MNYKELTTKLARIDKKYRGDDYNKWRQEAKNKLLLEYNRGKNEDTNKNST